MQQNAGGQGAGVTIFWGDQRGRARCVRLPRFSLANGEALLKLCEFPDRPSELMIFRQEDIENDRDAGSHRRQGDGLEQDGGCHYHH